MNDILLFTPAALLDVLRQVDELKDVDVGVSENEDGSVHLSIGSSKYELKPKDETEVAVSEKDLDSVEDASQEAYTDMESSGDISLGDKESVESGLLKQIAKTLLIGGVVRLGAKLLKG